MNFLFGGGTTRLRLARMAPPGPNPHTTKMNTTLRAILGFLVSFFVIFQIGAAQDATIHLGDTFKGRIAFPTDEDELDFNALAGTQFGCTATATKPLALNIQIVDLTTEASLNLTGFVKGAGTKTVTVAKLPLPSTGSYRVIIGSSNGEIGNYTFKTSGKLLKTATSVKFEQSVTPGLREDFTFLAFPGSTVSATIEPSKNSPAVPFLVTFLTPAGLEDVSANTTIKGKKITIKNVATQNLGLHALRVDNSGAAGNVKVTITIKLPKIKLLTITEPPESLTPGTIAGAVDLQIADAFAEVEPNNSVQTDQFIGQLSPGKIFKISGSSSNGDTDLYRFVVSQSQSMTITLVHDVANDFDFGIVDNQTGQIINGLLFATETEPEVGIVDITFNGAGQAAFDVAVVPFSGAGTYQLTVVSAPPSSSIVSTPGSGGTNVSISRRTVASKANHNIWTEQVEDKILELDREFVSGEFVVQLRDPKANVTDFAARQGLAVRAASPGGSFVVNVPGAARGVKADRKSRITTIQRKQQIRALPEVAFAEPNYIYHIAGAPQGGNTPNDPFFNLQWHYPLIHLPEAWAITKGSANVIVAIIDTGITAHPDLLSRDSGFGFDMISDPQIGNDGDGFDNNPTDPGDLSDNGQSSWHGTHVAGTIGAATNNGIGVSGVDWFCKLMHVRALGVGGGSNFDIGEAMKYAAKLTNASGSLPTTRANVINMSLGGPGFSQNQQNIVDQVRAAGVTVIAAAGNNNSNQAFFPASYNGVISVSAVDFSSQKAPYSNFGTGVDIAAPGGDLGADLNQDNFADGVLSTLVDDSKQPFKFIFKFYQGTSMASPHVAGVAALLLSVNANLTPDQVETALESTATDLGAVGKDQIFGHGLVNALAAIQSVNAAPGGGPVISASTGSILFGGQLTNLPFNIINIGGGTLNYTATDSEDFGGNWLSVSPGAGAAPATLTATVNRTGLAAGVYTGKLQINSNGGNLIINISMEVTQTNPTTPSVGTIVILAVDANTLETAGQADADINGNYVISNLPPGSYLIIGGADLDNDNTICGTGEPCGIFPSLDSPEPVDLPAGGALTGVSFAVVDQFVLPTFVKSKKAKIPPGGFHYSPKNLK